MGAGPAERDRPGPDDRRERLRARLGVLGFDAVRFAAAATVVRSGLREWLAAGHQADMAWMERTADKRLDPGLVLPGVRSVIALGVTYGPLAPRLPGAPAWARYAQHEDYHDTLKPALAEAGRAIEEIFGVGGADHRYYVDTGPVLERAWAAAGGLGFIGKNAMLISRAHGNWLLLAAILTRVELEPDPPLVAAGAAREPRTVGLLCGTCTRCLDACPTAAFPAPGVVDARRCISYQTIENKGIIPRELRPGIGSRIYGCDICLEVCPWNRFAREGRGLLLKVRGEIAALSLREILGLGPESFARVFRGTPIKRLKLRGLLRNACVVAGNSGERGLVDALLPLARHPEAVVRAHAVWAVRRLAGAAAAEILAATRAAEGDPEVLAEYEGRWDLSDRSDRSVR